MDPGGEQRRLWRIDVADLAVLDLRLPEARQAVGVELGDLIGPREACQALARTAQRMGADGLVVPSAARDGAWNLVVFSNGLGAVTPAGSAVRNPAPPPR